MLKKNDLIIQIRSGDWGLDRGLLLEGGKGADRADRKMSGVRPSPLWAAPSCDNGLLKHFVFLNLEVMKTTKMRLRREK